jgi:hypothetical protein
MDQDNTQKSFLLDLVKDNQYSEQAKLRAAAFPMVVRPCSRDLAHETSDPV